MRQFAAFLVFLVGSGLVLTGVILASEPGLETDSLGSRLKVVSIASTIIFGLVMGLLSVDIRRRQQYVVLNFSDVQYQRLQTIALMKRSNPRKVAGNALAIYEIIAAEMTVDPATKVYFVKDGRPVKEIVIE